jgi:hypothetical protein
LGYQAGHQVTTLDAKLASRIGVLPPDILSEIAGALKLAG